MRISRSAADEEEEVEEVLLLSLFAKTILFDIKIEELGEVEAVDAIDPPSMATEGDATTWMPGR